MARLHVAIRPKRLRVLANLSQARRDLIYILLQYSKVYRFRVYPNLVESLIDIKLYKYLSSIYLG